MGLVFHAYARTHCPAGAHSVTHDAYGFCRHVRTYRPDSLCKAEWNRPGFAFSQERIALRFVRHKQTGPQTNPAIQLFFRFRQPCRELIFYFRL